jgi:deferrochelatase/peroxidase EfeB
MVPPVVSVSGADSVVDYTDVQGLVRFGHGQLTRACFYALHIRDAAAARNWLLTAPITTAQPQKPLPATAMQVALSARGMEALGVPEAITSAFSAEFFAGMTGDDNRSRRLGDVGASSPSRWRWGAGSRIPHVLVMLFATSDAWTACDKETTGPAWQKAFDVVARLPAADLDRNEPFGFADGLSQPEVDWAQSRVVRAEEPAYTNLTALGEFLLGYRNEYGKYTERPLVAGTRPGIALPLAPEAPDKLDVGRNGSYLVLRELSQDVRGFWQYQHGRAGSAPESRRLAEAMVGRTISGEPLARAGAARIPGVGPDPEDIRLNQFTFSDDPDGDRCPLGAHIRRANPRTGDFAGAVGGPVSRLVHRLGFGARGWRDDRIASTRFHRVLRRGRKYGPALTPDEALQSAPPDDPERGLYFVCLNANIARQFEFIQNAWLMSPAFEGLDGETDPLVGNRVSSAGPCDTFSVPSPTGAPRRLYGVPEFVTVRGGAYFFLPGIRALRYLATAGAA